jgi:hypothetical protein
VRVGAKRGSREHLALEFEREPDALGLTVHQDYKAVASGDGRFQFTRVPAGRTRVARYIEVGERKWRRSHGRLVAVGPGQTAAATVGGSGRPVIGRIVAPGHELARIDWSSCQTTLKRQVPRHRLPDRWQAMSQDQRRQWVRQWIHTDAGNAFDQLAQTYAVRLAANGAFRIDDVPEGTYQLTIGAHKPAVCQLPSFGRAHEAGIGLQLCSGEVIGGLSYVFRVLPMPCGRSDRPLDLGPLRLTVTQALEQTLGAETARLNGS